MGPGNLEDAVSIREVCRTSVALSDMYDEVLGTTVPASRSSLSRRRHESLESARVDEELVGATRTSQEVERLQTSGYRFPRASLRSVPSAREGRVETESACWYTPTPSTPPPAAPGVHDSCFTTSHDDCLTSTPTTPRPMTTRPRLSLNSSSRRPASAIFLGTTPPALPELPPEPASPIASGASSPDSGLPSPPASNSTGSGSNGELTSHGGSLRLRASSVSFDTPEMPHVDFDKALSARERDLASSEEEDEPTNDEEHTAKFSGDRRRSLPDENAHALQRIKSLNQRSRLVMDKLTARSRNTPSPSLSARTPLSNSPMPPTTSSSSSSSASSSRHSHAPSHSSLRPRTSLRHSEPPLSGSETERENPPSAASDDWPSSPEIATTPPPQLVPLSAYAPGSVRQRRISAPSPGKAVSAAREAVRGARGHRTSSPAAARTAEHRPATALSIHDEEEYLQSPAQFYGASQSSMPRRTATTLGRRSRQPLPREFLDNSQEEKFVRQSLSSTLDNRPISRSGRRSPSPTSASTSRSTHGLDGPPSPRATRASTLAGRSATVREVTRRHQTRWQSEDLTSNTSGDHVRDRDLADDQGNGLGRRQSIRGGSAESPLAGYALGERSLLGEGLRAAGIRARRREDVFAGDESFVPSPLPRRMGSYGVSSILLNGAGAGRAEHSPAPSGRASRLGDGGSGDASGAGTSTATSTTLVTFRDPRTPGAPRRTVERTNFGGSASVSRPATSLAEYGDDMNRAPRTAPPALRTYKSAYPFGERDRSDVGSPSYTGRRDLPLPLEPERDNIRDRERERERDRDGGRSGTLSRAGGAFQHQQQLSQLAQTDHTRLMFTALERFEAGLEHAPALGGGAAGAVPDVLRHAQNIVRTTERLNALLREGTQTALDEHIRSAVDDDGAPGSGSADGVAVEELWRRVSAEFRESLRASDELVRMLTDFFLGVGKVLRDTGSSVGTRSEDGSPAQHLRTASLDDADVARRSLRVLNGASAGRRSAEGSSVASGGSRRSWEAAPSDRLDAYANGRPQSSLNQRTDRSHGPFGDHGTNATLGLADRAATSSPAGASRRLFNAREQGGSRLGPAPLVISDSLETVRAYGPSPTPPPAARRAQPPSPRQQGFRAASMPLKRPTPLPTLPSESILMRAQERQEQERARQEEEHTLHRRKSSAASAATVRATPKFPVSVTTPNTTTALSPHTAVSTSSPVAGRGTAFPLLRSESGGSTASATSSGSRPQVTFARSSTISRLSELHDRERAPSSPSAQARAMLDDAQVTSPMSGSETERPSRRRTYGPKTPRSSLEGIADEMDEIGQRQNTVNAPKSRRRSVTEIFGRA